MRFIKTIKNTSRLNLQSEWTGWIDRELWIRMDRIVTVIKADKYDPIQGYIIILLDPQETMLLVDKKEEEKLLEWLNEDVNIASAINHLTEKISELTEEIKYAPSIGTRIAELKSDFNKNLNH